jgi:hypothetical protein
VFNFIFPYDKLIASGANIVAIYGPNILNHDEFCAFYLLTTDTENILDNGQTEFIPEWDPIIKKDDEEETNKIFAVEWTMSLFNKK